MRFRYTGQQLIGELGLYHYKARAYSPGALSIATQKLAMADRALKGDITLVDTLFTGPQIKALGRELGERVILEHVVDSIVQLAG